MLALSPQYRKTSDKALFQTPYSVGERGKKEQLTSRYSTKCPAESRDIIDISIVSSDFNCNFIFILESVKYEAQHPTHTSCVTVERTGRCVLFVCGHICIFWLSPSLTAILIFLHRHPESSTRCPPEATSERPRRAIPLKGSSCCLAWFGSRRKALPGIPVAGAPEKESALIELVVDLRRHFSIHSTLRRG